MALDYSQLDALVRSASWSGLIGQPESDFFDCKKTVYDLAAEAQKQELAKDVSSFGNAGGGFVLLGVETQKGSTHPGDEVSALRPFPRERLDSKQYYDLLNDWVIPKLEGVTVEWIPEASDATQGFGVIRVPPQTDSLKPFVIAKTVLDDGRRRDLLVGFAQRRRDTSQPATALEIAKWLSDGRNYQRNIQLRLDEIAAKIESGGSAVSSPVPVVPSGPDPEKINNRIQASLSETGLINRPHFVLTAVPDAATQVKTIFQSGPGTITAVLENPPVLRYAGWSLETRAHAKIVEGLFRQLTNGDRKVLRLYRDGVLVHAVAADSDFLGWGESPEQFREKPRLISLALIEVTYLFCCCYAEVLKDLSIPSIPATNISLRTYLGGMRDKGTAKPVGLNPYAVNTFGFRLNDDVKLAPADTLDRTVTVEGAQFDPGAVAYELVKEIYLWFGFELSNIPYVSEVDGIMRVDPEKIKATR